MNNLLLHELATLAQTDTERRFLPALLLPDYLRPLRIERERGPRRSLASIGPNGGRIALERNAWATAGPPINRAQMPQAAPRSFNPPPAPWRPNIPPTPDQAQGRFF